MNTSHRFLVVLTLAAIVGAPLAALHPVVQHLFDSGQSVVPVPFKDAAAIGVLMLVVVSVVPLVSLTRILANWLNGSVELRALWKSGDRKCTGDGFEYVLIDIPQVLFFTAGAIRPRIYASTGAVECLSTGAFRAGLLHERAHQLKRDVAWRAALAAIERAFSPIPTVRAAVRSLSLEAEFAADRAALAAGAAKRDLFDAMVATARGTTTAQAVGLATSGTLQRLTVLVDPSVEPPRPTIAGLLWALAALGLLPGVIHSLLWLGAVCL